MRHKDNRTKTGRKGIRIERGKSKEMHTARKVPLPTRDVGVEEEAVFQCPGAVTGPAVAVGIEARNMG